MTLSRLLPTLAQTAGAAEDPAAVAARLARQLFTPEPETSLPVAALVLVAGVAVQVLAGWIAAKVVVGNENATLRRAAYLWFLSVLAAVGMAVFLVVCLMLAATTGQPILMMLVLGGWSLLALTLGLLLPAKVFETDLLRALGIVVISFILVLAGQAALDQAQGRSTFTRWVPVQRMILDSPEGRQRRLRHLVSGDSLAAIERDLDRLSAPAERRKPFAERQESLRAIFTALEQRRKTLPAGDRADYQAVRQRYEDLLTAARADYAASLRAASPGR